MKERRSKWVANKALPRVGRSTYTILLYEEDAEYLRKLGNGNRSEGARQVIQEKGQLKRPGKRR